MTKRRSRSCSTEQDGAVVTQSDQQPQKEQKKSLRNESTEEEKEETQEEQLNEKEIKKNGSESEEKLDKLGESDVEKAKAVISNPDKETKNNFESNDVPPQSDTCSSLENSKPKSDSMQVTSLGSKESKVDERTKSHTDEFSKFISKHKSRSSRHRR